MCSITFGVSAGGAAQFLFSAFVGIILGVCVVLAIFSVRRKRTDAKDALQRRKFLADLAHELQTPIAILRGNLEIIESDSSHEVGHSLRVMRTTINGLSRFVSSSLAAAMAKSSEYLFARAVIPVRKFLDEVVEDCFVLGEYNDVRISAMSEDVAIEGDKDKLKEVLFNLIGNALKHTSPGGTIALSARQRESMVEIAVTDTGAGIAPEVLAHIFERFYRIESVGNPGTGIGLYLCRQIVEAHGGTIFVESELGKGSCFVVQLPIYLL